MAGTRVSKPIPRDDNSAILQLVPPVTALAVTNDDSISTATDVTLDTSTRFIEVNAIDDGIYLRYAATASSSNFDEFILMDTVRHYVIPSGVTVISVIDSGNSGKVRIIEK